MLVSYVRYCFPDISPMAGVARADFLAARPRADGAGRAEDLSLRELTSERAPKS